MQFSAADIKPHLVVEDEDPAEDALIDDYISAAETRIQKYLRRDLDAEFGATWPQDLRQAVRIMVADQYENRGSVIVGGRVTITDTVKEILADYRNFAG